MITIKKGVRELIEVDFSKASREIALEMSETFVPAQVLDSADHRELSLMLISCKVSDSSNKSLTIFGEP